MSLVLGDVHGNYPKVKAFLEYRPEKEHIFVGDYTDSFRASDSLIIETTKMIFDSDAICLVGNHDLQYFQNASRAMQCTGFRPLAYGFIHLMEMYKHRLQASCVRDGYIITHGGISKGMSDYMTDISIEEISKWFNHVFDEFKNSPLVPETLSPIFNCRFSGGTDTFSGPFWARYKFEEYEIRFNQIFGHTRSDHPVDIQTKNFTELICVDCPQYVCYNTETKQFEDFFPEEFKKSRDRLETTY